jgi:hypothetical protein
VSVLTLAKMKAIAQKAAHADATPMEHHEAAKLLQELLDDIGTHCMEYDIHHDAVNPVAKLMDAAVWSAHVMAPPNLDRPPDMTRTERDELHAEQMRQRLKEMYR